MVHEQGGRTRKREHITILLLLGHTHEDGGRIFRRVSVSLPDVGVEPERWSGVAAIGQYGGDRSSYRGVVGLREVVRGRGVISLGGWKG